MSDSDDPRFYTLEHDQQKIDEFAHRLAMRTVTNSRRIAILTTLLSQVEQGIQARGGIQDTTFFLWALVEAILTRLRKGTW